MQRILILGGGVGGTLTANLLVSSEPPIGRTALSAWAARNGQNLGVEWASEIQRHYR